MTNKWTNKIRNTYGPWNKFYMLFFKLGYVILTWALLKTLLTSLKIGDSHLSNYSLYLLREKSEQDTRQNPRATARRRTTCGYHRTLYNHTNTSPPLLYWGDVEDCNLKFASCKFTDLQWRHHPLSLENVHPSVKTSYSLARTCTSTTVGHPCL